jgi:hypothetical protein
VWEKWYRTGKSVIDRGEREGKDQEDEEKFREDTG